VVDHQHFARAAVHRHRRERAQVAAARGRLGQHAFHVDQLDQLALVAGDAGQVVAVAAEVGRRLDVFDGDVDDPVDPGYQETLHGAVEFGHDQVVGFAHVLAVVPDRARQVEHRHAAAAYVGGAG